MTKSIEKSYEQFNQEFNDYMFDELNLIALEVSINYIPLRNHAISFLMLENDEMYNSYSQSEIFDWKNNFLTPEQEKEHICLMSNQFRDKCYDWINSDDNTELENEMTLSFGEELSTELFDMFCLNIWKNYVGDCMSVSVK
jgi:hypothetical protein